MRHGKLIRATAITTLALAVSAAVSGCAGFVGSAAIQGVASSEQQHKAEVKTEANKGKPSAGECWVSSVSYADYATWGTRRPVNCREPHQLYTFAVLPLAFAHTGKLFDKEGYVPDAIYQDGENVCVLAEDSDLGDFADESRVQLEFYFPGQTQWNKGARWIRCDFGILAVGGSVPHPKFENLPVFAGLRRTMENAPYTFNLCTNDPGGIGPKGKNAVYASCSANPQWVLHGVGGLDPGGAYPTMAQMNAAYRAVCESQFTDATHVTYPIYPTKSDWSQHDFDLECWIGRR